MGGMWLCEDFVRIHTNDQFRGAHMFPPLGEDVLGFRNGGVVWDMSGKAV